MMNNSVAKSMAETKNNQVPNPLITTPNQSGASVPKPRYRKKVHKVVYSTYFRILFSAFLVFLLFATAAVIAFQSEQRKKASEDFEKAVPDAEILLPIPDLTPTPAVDTSNWNEYVGNGISFKYPPSWSYDAPLNEPESGKVEFKDEKKELLITISFYDPGVVGISYCEATPEDEKCEAFVTENDIVITIDWDLSGKANAIFDGTSITLEKVTPDTRQIFRQILSTFQFIEE